MRRFWQLAVIWLLIVVSGLRADFLININDQVANQHPGWCVWACCETLARNMGMKKLNGLVDYYAKTSRRGGTYPCEAKTQLDILKVDCFVSAEGEYRWDKLKDACDRKLGAIVGVKGYPFSDSYHAIAIVDITADKIIFFDPNTPGRRWKADVQWLREHWSGFLIIIYPDQKP